MDLTRFGFVASERVFDQIDDLPRSEQRQLLTDLEALTFDPRGESLTRPWVAPYKDNQPHTYTARLGRESRWILLYKVFGDHPKIRLVRLMDTLPEEADIPDDQ